MIASQAKAPVGVTEAFKERYYKADKGWRVNTEVGTEVDVANHCCFGYGHD